ncbi:Lipase 4 [Komagataella phaffii CBS 7435]|uniref:Patatin-like phospholipase domain-containing protein n=2 Tax=Komagataella phaffii TaxID=460519 RepID=C4R0S0_KOMPG|nr:Triacylglycerol lipase involved in triacylglycerol mobilization and degradation [Komagataella phaffii GS115]AOA62791.1 GQ67_00510T0 [Komagataella phaffii]CAH2448386.1 Lipase 4 [Komagataella phaffii CBS 7435]AOA68048.1 GQ68_00878T0 [Komagataella phaffii GS115]CAY69094.1 Triacylglycerol lipase involved in triacylglycerol mobilization and degradation [Komagataella phaffii GS115]CCA38512.1 Lipase 4 [Komagataella phaffii CBS 7435]
MNLFGAVTDTLFAQRELLKSRQEPSEVHSPSRLFQVVESVASVLRKIPFLKHCIGPPVEGEELIRQLLAQQKVSTSYEEWYEVSQKLDILQNLEIWKYEKEFSLYDYQLVERRLAELRETINNKDYPKLLYLVRTTWSRNLGNMGNDVLYAYSHVGTKKLIEEYVAECVKGLNILASEDNGLDDTHVLGTLIQTRKAIGRTALVLSGGGCFGLIHIGVMATLLEQNMFPKVIAGSSAGAILASILSVQTPEETLQLLSTIATRKFEIFEENNHREGILVCLSRFLKYGTWFDNCYLQRTMQTFLGDLTFKESYNRTGRILNITVSPAAVHEQPTLLNYLTAPNVLLWSAVCVSCSLPGVFPSSTILEKDPRTGEISEWNKAATVKFVDGSVHNDLPIARLSEMFNVDHIIACQVNPHVVPFLKMAGDGVNTGNTFLRKSLQMVNNLASDEITHYLTIAGELGIAPNVCTKLKSVLAQQYSGDITILPDLRLTELNLLLTNPTPEFLLDASIRGARATWPQISMIQNHCSVEFELDRVIGLLRSRLVGRPVLIERNRPRSRTIAGGRRSDTATSTAITTTTNTRTPFGSAHDSSFTPVYHSGYSYYLETPAPAPAPPAYTRRASAYERRTATQPPSPLQSPLKSRNNSMENLVRRNSLREINALLYRDNSPKTSRKRIGGPKNHK